MLHEYLMSLEENMERKAFEEFMLDVENDIKVNRIAFGKRTNQKEFKQICEILIGVLDKCPEEVRA